VKPTKRVNQKELANLQRLAARVAQSIHEGRWSADMLRADMRAVMWAEWWITELLREPGQQPPEKPEPQK
jgi:hypothetical protein